MITRVLLANQNWGNILNIRVNEFPVYINLDVMNKISVTGLYCLFSSVLLKTVFLCGR